jgi:hypothetical protein
MVCARTLCRVIVVCDALWDNGDRAGSETCRCPASAAADLLVGVFDDSSWRHQPKEPLRDMFHV